jgi:predicted MFS family arabinose efflux permease
VSVLERVRPTPAATERPTIRQWLSVAAVTLGVFTVMTAEMLPVGLLTPIGADLGVSEGTAGLMITVPGLVAAVAAPVSTVLTGRADRRRVLLALAALVAAANFAAALVTDFGLMLAARVLVGISIGAFWAIAGGIALRLVPETYVPRATAAVYGGIGAATVLGVPAGTFIGGHLGWRTALAVLGCLSLAALAAIAALVPRLPSTGAIRFSSLTRMVRANAGVRTGLALTFLIVSAHFIAYTYIRAILTENGIADTAAGGLLMAFGIAALLATVASGSLIGTRLRATLVGLAAAMALAMALMALTVSGVIAAAAVLMLWGIGYGMVSPAVQTWYLRAAPREAEAATSLNTLMFNLSIALGSLAGGLVVDSAATRSVLWIGALLLVPVAFLAGRGRAVEE